MLCWTPMSLTVLALVLLSAVIHAGWNFLSKKAGGDLAVLTLGAAVAGIVSVPLALPFLPSMEALRAGAPYMVATAVVHFFYFTALGRAYEHGEISAVYPVARGAGVALTGLLAVLLLGDHVTLVGGAGIAAVTIGALLIRSVGSGEARHDHAMLMALAVSVLIVAYSLIDKLAVGVLHPTVYNGALFGGAAILLSSYLAWREPGRLTATWNKNRNAILTIGIGQVASYLILLFALRMSQVSYVVAARELSVVFGALLGVKLLGERMTEKKAFGIAVIVAGLVLVKLA